jgi:hypothetical protein
MGSLMHGSREMLDKFIRTQRKIAKDPILRNKSTYHDLTREEKMTNMYEKFRRFADVIDTDQSYENNWWYSSNFQGMVSRR